VTRLIWDFGTAYDLFISLKVLHEPGRYGLRAAWARGVRARLSSTSQQILKQTIGFVWPVRWVHTLPDPKDGQAVLKALGEIPVGERLATLTFSPEVPPEAWEVLGEVSARRAWDEPDLARLQAVHASLKPDLPRKSDLQKMLDWWSRPVEFGECYLGALREYYEVFFAEEELRIRPALKERLAHAQSLAEGLEIPALLEELSQGVQLAEVPRRPELVLAPSFWSTPLLIFAVVDATREVILFGARPPEASLVPGEPVPDMLVHGLKALAHPTRLRILRYLATRPHSPTELAQRLRLRPPTVIHHLDTLRMAGLVRLTLEAGDKRRYAVRRRAVRATFAALERFLEEDEQALEMARQEDGAHRG
jgi:DNA-binding transcriptional ArsR family regulator